MSKNVINNYTGVKRLYFEFSLVSSSDESDFDFEVFNSGMPKKEKKLPEPTLKRSKRQGMCLCSGDESKSECSETEKDTKSIKPIAKKRVKNEDNNSNLVEPRWKK